uniref:hypothetical protein n=1 Tax=Rhodonellum psychrophilum TaxID=336828 RepID=UPI00200AC2B5|nr:hypothetical protein [Rhodonellum psychrophilum]
MSFFRINDPFRFIGIFFLMLLFGGIYIWVLDVPMLQPELIWMLAGERMSEGFSMYIDIIDDTGPLSATVYWMIHVLFGKNLFAYKLLGGLVIFFQIAYINGLFIRYKSFDENTYIPALVLVVLFHFSFDILTLSPALMGSTFIVLALGQLFSQTVLQKEGSDSILLVGIFGGIAACFHFPLVIFLPYLIVAGVTVSGFNFNQFLLSLLGYFLPIIGCGLYYFWIDGLPEFVIQYIFATRVIDVYYHVQFLDLILLLIAPFSFAAAGYFIGTVFKLITVNQQKQKQLIILFLLFALLTIFLTNRRTPYQFVILLPGLTYFITQIFLYLQRGFLLQFFSISFLISIPLIGFGWTNYQKASGKIDSYAVAFSEKHRETAGKSILVLGNDLGYYQQAKLATPYLNYNLSKGILRDFNNFAEMAAVYQDFLKEKPEMIIDEDGLFEQLVERIPLLENSYLKKSEGIYVLK